MKSATSPGQAGHQAADVLSRIVTDGTNQAPLDEKFSTLWERQQDKNTDPEDEDLLGEVTIARDRHPNLRS